MTWNSANGYIFAKGISTRIYVCCKIDIAIFIWKHNPHLLAFVSSSHMKWMLTIVLIASDNHMFSNQIELFGLINRHRAYYPSCMSSYLFCETKTFSGTPFNVHKIFNLLLTFVINHVLFEIDIQTKSVLFVIEQILLRSMKHLFHFAGSDIATAAIAYSKSKSNSNQIYCHTNNNSHCHIQW